jgi:NADH dehydrogenase/NADH:ubiquinone oxidoreductase subunit G|uniref:NADH dehydrogenase subunit 11 n=1 Tax=Phaeodactylum tricornutum TaxID=2850 RepID=F1DGQ3_PHATR|nr:NADH dehydrogenase subunit 11 [Phaeodactylum tricornutum]ADY18531.1 NADH dehydrogenase subunit 11 [Phaeodactylum tricornutum]
MGALTLKSFPFELRGWDIEKFESLDPTDGFGTQTRVYVSKDLIVQIEPDYDLQIPNTWLSDKGRQFFDGIFSIWESNKCHKKTLTLEKQSWLTILKSMIKVLYIFDQSNRQKSKSYFFTLIFENLSSEILSLLVVISQNYSFLKVRRAENFRLNNDLESEFQLNLGTNGINLKESTLCLLLAVHPRYEGYHLNLSLRQRTLKGGFKCLAIGSLANLTFPVSFLGSNLNVVKTINEGNNLTCQDLKNAKKPILILNTEGFKRNDNQNSIETLKILKHSNIFNKTWNLLNPSLTETGVHALHPFLPISSEDLTNFSSLYFLNVTVNNIPNLKLITALKLLAVIPRNPVTKGAFFDQNNQKNVNFTDYNKNNGLNRYFYLPTNMFYENDETFISTGGLIKKTTKLIFDKKTKNNWQILRRFFKEFKNQLSFLSTKDNNILFFNLEKIADFRNYINFQYYATRNLTKLNFYLNLKNYPFSLGSKTVAFRPKIVKVNNTKLKYWLDDFFNGGKDDYSQNSLIMSNCSKILRLELTNFF